jgi:hypothetical protein
MNKIFKKPIISSLYLNGKTDQNKVK